MRKNLLSKYLLLVDICSIVIAFLLSAWIRFGGITQYLFSTDIYKVALAIILSLYIAIFYLSDTNRRFLRRGFSDEIVVVGKNNCILAITLTTVMYLFQEGATYSRLFFLCFFLLNTLITYLIRQYYKMFLLTAFNKSDSGYKLMIITTSDQAKHVLNQIRNENEGEYQLSYFTIIDKDMVGLKIDEVEVRASLMNMFAVAKKEVLDGVFIHIPNDSQIDINLDETLLEFQNMGATVDLSINTFGLKINEKVVRELSGYHVLTFSSQLFNESQLHIKRLIDILGGLVGCVLTMCLILIVAPAIRIESPGPIFFSQIRMGKNGRRFRIYKFRSMYTNAEKQQANLQNHNEMNGYMFKMKDDPRITKVGRFLRRTSIDEFPQFFNILKGEMSLVGTRPPTETEFLQYEGRHKRRLALKSGLTGLWQVSGRNDVNNFEDVVKMDLEYIDNWSMLMDVKILIKTIGVVLFRKGSR